MRYINALAGAGNKGKGAMLAIKENMPSSDDLPTIKYKKNQQLCWQISGVESLQ